MVTIRNISIFVIQPIQLQASKPENEYPMCWWYKSTAQDGTSNRPSDAKGAYVPNTGFLWQPKAVLKVHFMNKIPGTEGWRMKSNNFVSTDNILEWANVWHEIDPTCVPKFELGSEDCNDIRVKFNTETGETWSKRGTRAEDVPPEEHTMLLALGVGDDDIKRYLVCHEFGHALGLGHEHQSPLAPELDKDKVINYLVGKCGMKKDAAEKKYEVDYKMDLPSSDSRTTPHDPRSIMQYPIPEECYKNPSEWQEHARGLGDFDPSLTETDKKEIVEMYRGSRTPAAGPSGTQGSQAPAAGPSGSQELFSADPVHEMYPGGFSGGFFSSATPNGTYDKLLPCNVQQAPQAKYAQIDGLKTQVEEKTSSAKPLKQQLENKTQEVDILKRELKKQKEKHQTEVAVLNAELRQNEHDNIILRLQNSLEKAKKEKAEKALELSEKEKENVTQKCEIDRLHARLYRSQWKKNQTLEKECRLKPQMPQSQPKRSQDDRDPLQSLPH